MNHLFRKHGVKLRTVFMRQRNMRGTAVFFQPGNAACAGNDHKALVTAEKPGQRNLCRCAAMLLGHGLQGGQQFQVVAEVVRLKTRMPVSLGLAPWQTAHCHDA